MTDFELLGDKLKQLHFLYSKKKGIGYNEEQHVDFYPIPVIVSAAFKAGSIETIAPYVKLCDILSTCLKHSEPALLVNLLPLI